jgi:hypothetical protein
MSVGTVALRGQTSRPSLLHIVFVVMPLPVLAVERSLAWTTFIVIVWTAAFACLVHCAVEAAHKKKKRAAQPKDEIHAVDLAAQLTVETAARVALQHELEQLKAQLKHNQDGSFMLFSLACSSSSFYSR